MANTIEQAFFSPPDLTKAKRVLCVQPHPDDNEIGMGGIIQWLVAQNITVDYLTVTDGGLGAHDETLCGQSLVAIRRKEAIAAGTILGVKGFHFLDLPDGSLQDVLSLAGSVCQLLRQERYDVVFCPDPYLPYEAHRDHIVVGQAVAQACISTSLLAYPPDTQTKPYEMQAIGFYFTKSPNTIIDTTPYCKQTYKAMAAHKSQISKELLELYRMYFTLRGAKLGKEKGYSHGEGVKVLAPMHLHCIVEAGDI